MYLAIKAGVAGAVIAIVVASIVVIDQGYLNRQTEPQPESPFRAPFVGKDAPDIVLPDARTGEPVSLSSLRAGRPAVVVLGSFHCPIMCRRLGEITRLHDRYGDDAQFILICTREAPHPASGIGPALERLGLDPNDPMARITAGLETFEVDWPCLVDSPDAKVGQAFDAYPERVFILDRSGAVAWDSRESPTFTEQIADAEARLQECIGAGQ
jgi:hypothetical protein